MAWRLCQHGTQPCPSFCQGRNWFFASIDSIKHNQHSALKALLQTGPNKLEGFGVKYDLTLLYVLAADGDLQTLQTVYKRRLAGLQVNRADYQGRAAQKVFDARVPQPDAEMLGV